MPLLSSFELLFETITPKALNPNPKVPDPVIVQAYFVLISNVGANPVDLTLKFTSTLPLLGNVITIFDLTNSFTTASAQPFPPGSGNVALPTISPSETGLFLLQPDIASLLSTLSTPNDITTAKFAARGYVEVSAPVGPPTQCLITPQTRGTFLNQTSISPLDLNVIAQEAYTLPTPNSNLFVFP